MPLCPGSWIAGEWRDVERIKVRLELVDERT